jgi:DNA-binding NtrC family response regulator
LRHADIRVVSATHRDLDQMVSEGRFREDLYYRISTFPIALPALARSPSTTSRLLADALLERVAPQRRLDISPAALLRMQADDFPGNVRELRNLLERAALLCDGDTLEEGHVQQALRSGRPPGRRPEPGASAPHSAAQAARPSAPPPDAPPGDLRSVEQAALRERVARHPGSRAALAAELGISERTLYRKLKAAGL